MESIDENKPKMLDSETQKKLNLLRRYWIAYKRTHHDLIWAIEENTTLLRFGECAKYNIQQLNESLYRYVETSISSLYWLFPKKGENFPFVHKFLREWRNSNHHYERFDFSIWEMRFNVGDNKYDLPWAYNILPNIDINKKLKDLVGEQFPSEKIATDATLPGLVERHHKYMQKVFTEYESKLNLPEKFLQTSNLIYGSFGGGKYDRFVSEDDFWSN